MTSPIDLWLVSGFAPVDEPDPMTMGVKAALAVLEAADARRASLGDAATTAIADSAQDPVASAPDAVGSDIVRISPAARARYDFEKRVLPNNEIRVSEPISSRFQAPIDPQAFEADIYAYAYVYAEAPCPPLMGLPEGSHETSPPSWCTAPAAAIEQADRLRPIPTSTPFGDPRERARANVVSPPPGSWQPVRIRPSAPAQAVPWTGKTAALTLAPWATRAKQPSIHPTATQERNALLPAFRCALVFRNSRRRDLRRARRRAMHRIEQLSLRRMLTRQ